MSGLEFMAEAEVSGAPGGLGSSFLSGGLLGGDLLADTFLPSKKEEKKKPKPKLWGNYRGSRYLIVKDEGAYMTLAKTLGGETISVSSCNVSDVSSSPTTTEKICPGNNQCRRKGLRQGPKCRPITPAEGLLRYPHPI